MSSLYFGGDFLAPRFQIFEDNSSPLGRIRSKLGQMILPGLPKVFEHDISSTNNQGDEKAITAMGILNTMETILTVMEDKEEVHAELEPIVLKAVR